MIDLWVEHASSVARASRLTRHAWVRERLATELGVPASDVPLRVDDCGALSLPGTARHLSLSHHGDWLALAASTSGPVGVDVLTVPDHADFVTDTALVLSPEEISWVRSSARARQGAAFAECWARKEAYAKARRTGLTGELRALTLSPGPHGVPDASWWTGRFGDAVVAVATLTPGPADVLIRRAPGVHA